LLSGSHGVAVARIGQLPRLTSIGVGPRICPWLQLLLLLLLLPAVLLQAHDALPAAGATTSAQQAGLSRGAPGGGHGPHHATHRIPAAGLDRQDNSTAATAATSDAEATETTVETATATSKDDAEQMLPQIPSYIRTTAMFFCIVIMLLGVVGNVMVSPPLL